MGYVKYNDAKSVKYGKYPWIGESQGQSSLAVEGDEGAFQKFVNGSSTRYDKKWDPNKVKQDDKFEIRFDFIKKQSSCYWNGNLLGILDDILSDKIYPAITITSDHEIECTKWELFYIKH